MLEFEGAVKRFGALVALGVAVGAATRDVILGVIAGAGLVAIATQMVRLWAHHAGPPASPH
jgi:hypothetical protein